MYRYQNRLYYVSAAYGKRLDRHCGIAYNFSRGSFLIYQGVCNALVTRRYYYLIFTLLSEFKGKACHINVVPRNVNILTVQCNSGSHLVSVFILCGYKKGLFRAFYSSAVSKG